MVVPIDNYGKLGTIDTLGRVSALGGTERHSLASIPDNLTQVTEPSMRVDADCQVQVNTRGNLKETTFAKMPFHHFVASECELELTFTERK